MIQVCTLQITSTVNYHVVDNDTTNDTFLNICSSHSNLLYFQHQYIELIAWLLSKENLLSSLYLLPSSNVTSDEEKELLKRFMSVLSLLCQSSCCISLLKTLQTEKSLLLRSIG